jgi:serine/threonine-protein kinase HipA
MMYHLDVWSRLAVEIKAGEMVCEITENGRAQGAFRYAPDFLARDDAFALDPVSLPLQPENFTFGHPGIARVFEDSLPDDWGKKLLIRKHKISRQHENIPTLLIALGSSGLGALTYSVQGKPAPPPQDTSTTHLSELLNAVEKFERGETRDSEISMILSAGSSPGGARPKALVYDEETGTHSIAKFSSIKDLVDVVRIEAATMALASKAGLQVPCTRLSPCGNRSVLLVERFDIVPGGRRHMISLQTLLKAEGYYTCRYKDILDVVRKFSAEPAMDSELLFRQMVFNAVVGNTDDHLKNFWMIYGAREGWRLSPAFDLVPDIGRRGEHVILFDTGPYCPGRDTSKKLGRSWGVSNSDRIVDEVFAAVSGWAAEFETFGVQDNEIQQFKEIDRNLVS